MVYESVVSNIMSTSVHLLSLHPGNYGGHESLYSWEWLRSWQGSFSTLEAQQDESVRYDDALMIIVHY